MEASIISVDVWKSSIDQWRALTNGLQHHQCVQYCEYIVVTKEHKIWTHREV